MLTSLQQDELKKSFYAKKGHDLLKPGLYCLIDVDFSKKILKGHNAKRAVIAQIKSVDFTEGNS